MTPVGYKPKRAMVLLPKSIELTFGMGLTVDYYKNWRMFAGIPVNIASCWKDMELKATFIKRKKWSGRGLFWAELDGFVPTEFYGGTSTSTVELIRQDQHKFWKSQYALLMVGKSVNWLVVYHFASPFYVRNEIAHTT